MRVLLTVALCVVVTTSAFASDTIEGDAHIRPQDERLAQVLRDGAARSATFKSLVDRIEASHVIVYLSLNLMMKKHLSGMLTWMSDAGDYRYVRASISIDLMPDQMIATVAHELQHAIEVIEDESVRDEKSLVALYRRIGTSMGVGAPSRWETQAAQRTGFQVRRELVSASAAAAARIASARM
jgi:hypothetical protein